MRLNNIYNLDCLEGLRRLPESSVDLTVTSPPYDNLKSYKGYSFRFEDIANEIYRITKDGGVVVWIVADATIKGSETGTSFKQALYFKELGFNIHDTMIWNKGSFSAVGSLKYRYAPVFEYMFVFSKGIPKTFNPIKDRENKWAGTKNHGTVSLQDGTTKAKSNSKIIPKLGQRFNIWDIPQQRQWGENRHPAPFPESIARDHILSWSNAGDVILDPFMGSGTTAKMALLCDRNYIGFEISKEYTDMAINRLKDLEK